MQSHQDCLTSLVWGALTSTAEEAGVMRRTLRTLPGHVACPPQLRESCLEGQAAHRDRDKGDGTEGQGAPERAGLVKPPHLQSEGPRAPVRFSLAHLGEASHTTCPVNGPQDTIEGTCVYEPP